MFQCEDTLAISKFSAESQNCSLRELEAIVASVYLGGELWQSIAYQT